MNKFQIISQHSVIIFMLAKNIAPVKLSNVAFMFMSNGVGYESIEMIIPLNGVKTNPTGVAVHSINFTT